MSPGYNIRLKETYMGSYKTGDMNSLSDDLCWGIGGCIVHYFFKFLQ